MTITTTHSYVKSVANGTNLVFLFDFVLLDDGDLEVYNGTNLVNPSDYLVTIDGDNYGGSVTFSIAPAALSQITLKRVMPVDQQTDYPVAGPFPPSAHEEALDKLTMLIQQVMSLTQDAISAAVWRGDWEALHDYNERDMVTGPDDRIYFCPIAHTSTTVFATDLAGGKWLVAVDTVGLAESVTAAVQADIAAALAEMDEAIASVNLPDPTAGEAGQVIVVNGTETGWELADAAGGGLEWSVETTNKDTIANLGYLMDTSSAAKTVTLHATPVVGDTVAVGDYAGTFGTNACTIARNSMLINGLASDLILNANGEVMTLVYSGATKGWITVGTVTADYPKTVLNKPFFHAQDQKAYNVDGGTSMADAWTKRTLNTVIYNDISGATLSSDAVNLPAGTYYVEGVAPGLSATSTSHVLGVFKDGVKSLQGYTDPSGPSANSVSRASVAGVVTLTAPGTIDLRYYFGTALATEGLGRSNNAGSITDASINSIYADLKIWQLDRSLEIAPKAVNSGLQAVAGLETEGGVEGFDITVSGNTLTIGKGTCMDSSKTVPLAFTANKTCVLPGTVNGDFYVFAVRLLDGVTFEARAYSTYAGPSGDAQIDKWRLVSFAKNNGSGVTMPYMQVGGRATWISSNLPVLTASYTNSLVLYDISAVIPVPIIDVELASTQAFYWSYNGTTELGYVGGGQLAQDISGEGVYLRGGTSGVVNITAATLRR